MRSIELCVFNDDIPINQLFDFVRDYNVTENYDGTLINNPTASGTNRIVKFRYLLAKLGNVYLTLYIIKIPLCYFLHHNLGLNP